MHILVGVLVFCLCVSDCVITQEKLQHARL